MLIFVDPKIYKINSLSSQDLLKKVERFQKKLFSKKINHLIIVSKNLHSKINDVFKNIITEDEFQQKYSSTWDDFKKKSIKKKRRKYINTKNNKGCDGLTEDIKPFIPKTISSSAIQKMIDDPYAFYIEKNLGIKYDISRSFNQLSTFEDEVLYKKSGLIIKNNLYTDSSLEGSDNDLKKVICKSFTSKNELEGNKIYDNFKPDIYNSLDYNNEYKYKNNFPDDNKYKEHQNKILYSKSQVNTNIKLLNSEGLSDLNKKIIRMQLDHIKNNLQSDGEEVYYSVNLAFKVNGVTIYSTIDQINKHDDEGIDIIFYRTGTIESTVQIKKANQVKIGLALAGFLFGEILDYKTILNIPTIKCNSQMPCKTQSKIKPENNHSPNYSEDKNDNFNCKSKNQNALHQNIFNNEYKDIENNSANNSSNLCADNIKKLQSSRIKNIIILPLKPIYTKPKKLKANPSEIAISAIEKIKALQKEYNTEKVISSKPNSVYNFF